jgi:hypothetical protein
MTLKMCHYVNQPLPCCMILGKQFPLSDPSVFLLSEIISYKILPVSTFLTWILNSHAVSLLESCHN